MPCSRGSVQIDEFLATGKVEALDPEVIEKQKVGLPWSVFPLHAAGSLVPR